MKYGIRVAFKICKDPEAESCGARGARKALLTYDGRIPVKRWIAFVVRRYVWCYLRQRAKHETTGLSPDWWHTEVYAPAQESGEELVHQQDLQVLVEHYIDGWPLDVIAREHGLSSKHAAAKRINAAKSRLLEASRDA